MPPPTAPFLTSSSRGTHHLADRQPDYASSSEMFTTVLVASVLAVSAQTDFYTDIDQQEDIILTNETGKKKNLIISKLDY